MPAHMSIKDLRYKGTDAIYLESIYVPPQDRGKGLMHEALREVTSKYGHRYIAVNVHPFRRDGNEPTLDVPKLEEVYARYDFERVMTYPNGDVAMVRGPNHPNLTIPDIGG